jgi:hypothetical protein
MSFVHVKHRKLSRRMVLRGLGGVALSLPLLESFGRSQARAQDAAPDTSFAIFFRQANGVACAQNSPLGEEMEPERFWPTATGALSAATVQGRALDELTEHLGRILVVNNINMSDFDYGDGHARGALQGLTARGPTVNGAAGDSEAAGESIDHRIGVELNPEGRESLFMYAGSSNGWLGGPCISYRDAGVRRAAIENPRVAYETIAGGEGGLSEQAAVLLRQRQMSVNDLVRDQMQRLLSSPRLSGVDRDKLELHFNNIRELEVQMGCQLGSAEQAAVAGGDEIYGSGDGDDVLATVRLHMDVTALAVACGHTRSVAIQVGNGNDGDNRYRDPDSGELMENFHYVSHRRLSHDSSGGVIQNSDVLHHKVDRQFAQMFKHLIDRLLAYPMPGGGTLLDHGVSVWYNDLGNGPDHSPNNTPFVLAGSAGGFFKQGEHIRISGDEWGENHKRMLNTIASGVGVRNASGGYLEDFGDPELQSGILSELMA